VVMFRHKGANGETFYSASVVVANYRDEYVRLVCEGCEDPQSGGVIEEGPHEASEEQARQSLYDKLCDQKMLNRRHSSHTGSLPRNRF
jgi:hypothetical protein